MTEKKLALGQAVEMMQGLQTLLKTLRDVHDLPSNIRIIQSYMGHCFVAQWLLKQGHTVSWYYPEYDLKYDNKKVEIKTAKTWNKNGKWGNVFDLKINQFDELAIVLLNDDNEPYGLYIIPEHALSECRNPHQFKVDNGKRPSFVYYDKDGLSDAIKKGYEIYHVEREVSEGKYLVKLGILNKATKIDVSNSATDL